MRTSHFLRSLSAPIFTITILIIIEIAKYIEIIPKGTDFLESIFLYLSSQGLFVVVLLSFAENLIFVGPYLPASVAILGVMSSTNGNVLGAVAVWVSITIPAALAQLCNFQLGKRLPAPQQNEDLQLFSSKLFTKYLMAYWHPYFGAIASIKSGQSRMQLKEYLPAMLRALVIWNVFWGLTMYNIGESVKISDGSTGIYIFLALLWLVYEVFIYCRNGAKMSI